jgi:AbrB family transcriptional regulator (stage V sporulation protein T)
MVFADNISESKSEKGAASMKATGIVRRIDELGRVVIPKEIRRTLRIREGDPLEIFTDREGEVILKKYSPIGELSDFAKEYVESLNQSLGCIAAIADKDMIVAVSGAGKKELLDRPISEDLENIMKRREKIVSNKSEDTRFYAVSSEDEPFTAQVIVPIYAEGDTVGAVILLSKDEKAKMGITELKVAETAAGFVGKQMEQ